MKGFIDNNRGKLIMACGTGKTFTALKVAERFAEKEGHARILFLVPSLALMSQSLKEWSDETEQPMHAYAVCSDIKVGRQKNSDLTDVAIHDLQIPATTDGKTLVEAMGKKELDGGMTVVFSTYQSIDAVAQARQAGLPTWTSSPQRGPPHYRRHPVRHRGIALRQGPPQRRHRGRQAALYDGDPAPVQRRHEKRGGGENRSSRSATSSTTRASCRPSPAPRTEPRTSGCAVTA
jgi:hypothetical protein